MSALAKRVNWLSIEDLACAHLCCILTKHLKISSITETKDNTAYQEVDAEETMCLDTVFMHDIFAVD